MLRLLSLPKTASAPMAVTNKKSHATLVDALTEFASLRAEWSSLRAARYKRK